MFSRVKPNVNWRDSLMWLYLRPPVVSRLSATAAPEVLLYVGLLVLRLDAEQHTTKKEWDLIEKESLDKYLKKHKSQLPPVYRV